MISVGGGLYGLYVLRTGARGALDLHGAKDELEAIDHLIRAYLVNAVYAREGAISLTEARRRVSAAVSEALTNCDHDECPRCATCHPEGEP